MNDWRLPSAGLGALVVLRRNVLVWRKLIGPALVFNFGEPILYLLGLGLGLGSFIGNMGEMPYLTFLASGLIASSAMTTASFEGTYSVFTRMIPQRTYEAILATPLEVDDILAGEMLWCGVKSLISAVAILVVASLLGVVASWNALWTLPIAFLIGLCFAGPAIVMSSIVSNYDFFSFYSVLVITPMFILSGVFYPIETMPTLLQTIVQVLPLSHAVALVRPLVANQVLIQPLLHVAVLLVYTVIGYYLAVVLVRRRLIV